MTKSIIQIFKACRYSFEGLLAILKERAFKQELLLVAILSPVFFIFSFSRIEIALLISSLIFVLIIEIVNSAIEAVVDRISTQKHALSKKAKDLGSLAVFLSLVNLAVVWGMILYGKII